MEEKQQKPLLAKDLPSESCGNESGFGCSNCGSEAIKFLSDDIYVCAGCKQVPEKIPRICGEL